MICNIIEVKGVVMKKFKPNKKDKNFEKLVISIRIEENKLEIIDKLASKIDISRNEFINQCLDYAIENIDFKEEKKN